MEYVNTPVSYAEEQEEQLQQALFALHQVNLVSDLSYNHF